MPRKRSLRQLYSQTDIRFLRGVGFSEFILFVVLLVAVFIFAIVDISTDILDHETYTHIISDIIMATFSLGMIGYLTYKFGQVRLALAHQVQKTENEKEAAAKQVELWQSKAAQLRQGISEEIEARMLEWNLSQAEREVSLLLLKGLSLKEIAEIRETSERTVRHQSLAIYAKANVSGRAELSAFFLEDFLDRSYVTSSDLNS